MRTTRISQEQLAKLATLAQLDIRGTEKVLAELLSDTLNHIDILNELDTSKVTETYQVTGLKNRWQKYKVGAQTLSQQEALANAKEVEHNLFTTEGVFDRA